MKVYIEREDREVKIKAKTVRELLKKLNINPITVLVAKNNELVTDEVKLSEKDEVKIISVISGG
ncbi:MAG: MoaD/ThiS family protein [Candidatus Nanoarchaeia archaeon]